MRNALGRITIQDARIGAHRMTVACPDSPPRASHKQHQAGWSSIALQVGGIHAGVLVILSSASTFQGGSEKRPRSPHAARHMLHRQRVNAGVRLSKQWPGGLWTIQDQSKRGCWTVVSLDTRHHGRGSCGGTAGELQVCFVFFFSLLVLTRELFMAYCLKGRTTSSLTGGGQSGIEWPGFSHDAEQQTANDWPSANGAGWTMRHGWVQMLGHP